MLTLSQISGMHAFDQGVIAFCIIGLAIVGHVFAVSFRRFFPSLQNVPRPKLAAVSRLWGSFQTVRGDVYLQKVSIN